MTSLAILDAGPLVAWPVRSDPAHDRVVVILKRADLRFVIPALCVAEAAYTIGKRHGARAESGFINGLIDFEIQAPTRSDMVRMVELMDRYADFPLGAADASVVAIAERLDTDLLVTTDRRHFGVVRPRHCEAFRILPELP